MIYRFAEIKEVIRQARIARNLTQAELAAAVGTAMSTISHIETGGDARLRTLQNVGRYLDLELVLVPRRVVPALEAVLHGRPGSRGDDEDEDEPSEEPEVIERPRMRARSRR